MNAPELYADMIDARPASEVLGDIARLQRIAADEYELARVIRAEANDAMTGVRALYRMGVARDVFRRFALVIELRKEAVEASRRAALVAQLAREALARWADLETMFRDLAQPSFTFTDEPSTGLYEEPQS